MDNDIKKLLKRQDDWQKTRKAESWIEKLNRSVAARNTLPSDLRNSRKRQPELTNTSSPHGNTSNERK